MNIDKWKSFSFNKGRQTGYDDKCFEIVSN